MLDIDSAFFIGSAHNINQDYAISGMENAIPYCIVSDGCSSSENTDWGSRLLSKACIKHIDKIIDDVLFSNIVINTADSYRNTLGLNQNSLDATLLALAVINDTVYIKAFGDGIIHINMNNGDKTTFHISYDKNAPYYLSYLLDDNRQKSYVDFCGEPKALINTGEREFFVEPWLNMSFNINDIKSCTLFSDGMESFRQTVKTETNISTHNISYNKLIEKFTTYSNTHGEFVKRRAIKALKDLKADCIINSDDLSIASFFA